MEWVQEVGKWSKSRVPMCLQLTCPWLGGNVEKAWLSDAPMLLFITLVRPRAGDTRSSGPTRDSSRPPTCGLSSYPWPVGDHSSKKQIDTPYRAGVKSLLVGYGRGKGREKRE